MEEFLSRLKDIFDPATIEAVKGPASLYGGFIVGLIWGIVMQKGRVCKYDVVSSLFRFQDFTIFRVGTWVIISGMLLIFIAKDLGLAELYVPKTVLLPQMLGGILFGAAVAIMGYCPGTAAVALGEGSLDAIPSIAGMIAGSVIYAEFFHDRWQDTLLKIGDIGRVTFYDLLWVNHWFIIVPVVIVFIMGSIGSTMFDWFLQLAGRILNYYDEATVGLEKIASEGSTGLSSYYKEIQETVGKIKRFVKYLSDKAKEE
jgi:hypothetical protein